MGNLIYGKPSRDIFVLGVTGTKGKSTALEIINSILEEAGKKTALISSVRWKIDKESKPNYVGNTMPGRGKIQKFLREAVDVGCNYALIEVTSQGITQHRHRFISWDVAIFLNLHPEHIEAHGSFEKYREAKVSFFKYVRKSPKVKKYFFINEDDPSAYYFKEAVEGVEGAEIILFSRSDVYKLLEELKKESLADWLRADFNIENVAAAVAFAKTRGIDMKVIKKALANFKGVEGRMDFVKKKPFSVVIDYAHTPVSLKAFYENLRRNYVGEKAKLICVFGSAGGGRDVWKRPEFGKIAASYCDKIVLTSEDPYKDDPQGIINDIKAGFQEVDVKPEAILEVLDRKEAIKKAILLAKKGDVVAITGMGSQHFYYGPEGKIPWNERKIIEEILK